MQEVNWACCPLVQENPITRTFIEQQARERKARVPLRITEEILMISCQPAQIPLFQSFWRLMKAELPITSIGCGSERQNQGLGKKRTGARLHTQPGPDSRWRPSGDASVPCAAFTAGVSGSVTDMTPSIQFVKAFVAESGVLSLLPSRFPGFLLGVVRFCRRKKALKRSKSTANSVVDLSCSHCS